MKKPPVLLILLAVLLTLISPVYAEEEIVLPSAGETFSVWQSIDNKLQEVTVTVDYDGNLRLETEDEDSALIILELTEAKDTQSDAGSNTRVARMKIFDEDKELSSVENVLIPSSMIREIPVQKEEPEENATSDVIVEDEAYKVELTNPESIKEHIPENETDLFGRYTLLSISVLAAVMTLFCILIYVHMKKEIENVNETLMQNLNNTDTIFKKLDEKANALYYCIEKIEDMDMRGSESAKGLNSGLDDLKIMVGTIDTKTSVRGELAMHISREVNGAADKIISAQNEEERKRREIEETRRAETERRRRNDNDLLTVYNDIKRHGRRDYMDWENELRRFSYNVNWLAKKVQADGIVVYVNDSQSHGALTALVKGEDCWVVPSCNVNNNSMQSEDIRYWYEVRNIDPETFSLTKPARSICAGGIYTLEERGIIS